MPLNTLNGNTATGVTNASAGGVTLGSNFIAGDNGSQRVGYIGIKIQNVLANVYNDFIPVVGDRHDRLNTGGGSLQVAVGGGEVLTVGTDVYTGNVPTQSRVLGTGPDTDYVAQPADQQDLNNGQTYVNATGPVSASAVAGGQDHMYPQNSIHEARKEKKFISTATGL